MSRRPDYHLVVDGTVITPRVRGRLVSLTLNDRRGGDADELDLVLSDHDGRIAMPRRGATIEVSIGWADTGLVNRGSYTVDEVEHSGAPDQLSIRARSANLRESLPGRRTQSWHGVTLGDIVRTIAGRHNLIASITPELSARAIAHLDQSDESDMHLLSRLAETHDAIATVKADHLLFIVTGAATTASGAAIPPVTITRELGDQHRFSVTDRDAYTGVIAHWQDIDGGERRQVTAGTDDHAKTLRTTYASEPDALDAARGEWRRIQRGTAELTLTLAHGRPTLYPETPATLSGWRPEIDGSDWVITNVNHSLSDSAYTAQVEMERRA